MGSKAVEPKLYLSFSLDAAVPANHIVRRLAAVVDFGFVRSLTKQHYSNTGQPSVDPVVLFKLWLLGYLFNIRSERRLCEEAGLNLAWRWFLGYERSEEHTSELQPPYDLVCRLLLEKKNRLAFAHIGPIMPPKSAITRASRNPYRTVELLRPSIAVAQIDVIHHAV